MLKMRLALVFGLLAIICLSSSTTNAEDPKSEPEPEAEAEPGAHDEDGKHGHSAGSKKSAAQQGRNPASAPWAFSVPALVTFVAVAKFIL